MALDVVSEVVVDAPRFAVADFASSPETATGWRARIDGAQWITAPRLRGGSRIAFRVRVMGRRRLLIFEVSEFRPGSRLVMRAVPGPLSLSTLYTWDSLPDGRTRMTLRDHSTLAGIWRLAAPLMVWLIRLEQRSSLRRLKRQVERLV